MTLTDKIKAAHTCISYEPVVLKNDVKNSLDEFIIILKDICDKVGVISMADIKWKSIEIFGEELTPYHGKVTNG